MDVSVEPVREGTACVSVGGDVRRGEGARELEDILDGLIAGGTTRILVDLSAVQFLNSKLLDTLVRVSARIHPRDGGVAVIAAQTYVRHMLEVTEAGGVLLLEDSRDAALAALAPA